MAHLVDQFLLSLVLEMLEHDLVLHRARIPRLCALVALKHQLTPFGEKYLFLKQMFRHRLKKMLMVASEKHHHLLNGLDLAQTKNLLQKIVYLVHLPLLCQMFAFPVQFSHF